MNDHEFSGAAAELIRRGLVPGSQLYTIVNKAWDNGHIAIETWTLPSGNVPIITLAPVSNFTKRLSDFRPPDLDAFTASVRESVVTEGEGLHTDLLAAMSYALTNHPEKAMAWWLSVGIVRQGILVPADYRVRGAFPLEAMVELVHPSWNSDEAATWNDPTRCAVEQAEGAECGTS